MPVSVRPRVLTPHPLVRAPTPERLFLAEAWTPGRSCTCSESPLAFGLRFVTSIPASPITIRKQLAIFKIPWPSPEACSSVSEAQPASVPPCATPFLIIALVDPGGNYLVRWESHFR